ncbi:MAG: hypothetical protein ACYTEX_20885 [Planctomycetota bacterium]
MGEGKKDALRVNFDRELELAFHGVKAISDTGLLALRRECLTVYIDLLVSKGDEILAL